MRHGARWLVADRAVGRYWPHLLEWYGRYRAHRACSGWRRGLRWCRLRLHQPVTISGLSKESGSGASRARSSFKTGGAGRGPRGPNETPRCAASSRSPPLSTFRSLLPDTSELIPYPCACPFPDSCLTRSLPDVDLRAFTLRHRPLAPPRDGEDVLRGAADG